MGSLWLKIRIWTKVVVSLLLLIYGLFFIAKNTQPINLWVWFFAEPLTTPLLIVVLGAFLVGVIGTLLWRTTLTTIRQIGELRTRQRAEKMDRQMAEMQLKAARLRPREAGMSSASPSTPSDIL